MYRNMYFLGFCECAGRTGSAVSLGSTYDADVGITGGRACVSRPSLPSQGTPGESKHLLSNETGKLLFSKLTG